MDTLYYDGRCSLCLHEINWLRKLTDSRLALVDIHSLNDGSIAIERQRLMAILHLKKANGDWVTGLDATVGAWSHTRLGWLFKPLRWPLIKPVADKLYLRWANSRVCKL